MIGASNHIGQSAQVHLEDGDWFIGTIEGAIEPGSDLEQVSIRGPEGYPELTGTYPADSVELFELFDAMDER